MKKSSCKLNIDGYARLQTIHRLSSGLTLYYISRSFLGIPRENYENGNEETALWCFQYCNYDIMIGTLNVCLDVGYKLRHRQLFFTKIQEWLQSRLQFLQQHLVTNYINELSNPPFAICLTERYYCPRFGDRNINAQKMIIKYGLGLIAWDHSKKNSIVFDCERN